MTSVVGEDEREPAWESPPELDDSVVLGECCDLVHPPGLAGRDAAVEGGDRADPQDRQEASAKGRPGASRQVRDQSSLRPDADHLTQYLLRLQRVEMMEQKSRQRPVKTRVAKRKRRHIRDYRRMKKAAPPAVRQVIELAIDAHRSYPDAPMAADPAQPPEKLAAPGAEIDDARCVFAVDARHQGP